MRLANLLVFFALIAGGAMAQTDVYKCGGTYTNNPDAITGCKKVEGANLTIAKKAPAERNSITNMAETGNAEAQESLGDIFLNEKEIDKAYKWYLKAAEQGRPRAQLIVGSAFATGNGLPQNDEMAIKWLYKAKNQNFEGTDIFRGMIHVKTGIYQNLPLARAIFEKEAKSENGYAQIVLGSMYETGWGIVKSNVNAYKWYAIAGIHGNYEGVNRRDRVSQKMNKEDIDLADTLTRNCIETQFKMCN